MILRHTVFQNYPPKGTKHIYFLNDTGQLNTGARRIISIEYRNQARKVNRIKKQGQY